MKKFVKNFPHKNIETILYQKRVSVVLKKKAAHIITIIDKTKHTYQTDI